MNDECFVIQDIIKEKLSKDISGAKETISILQNGLSSCDTDSWKGIVDRLYCMYNETLHLV